MIYYSIPYNSDKNIGKYYNAFLRLLGDDDFACFIDGDACFTTNNFGTQLEDITKKYPECGLFVGKANRIGCKWQREGDWNSDNIKQHRLKGEQLQKQKYSEITDKSNVDPMEVLGGVVILIKKKTWKELGGFKEDGMLGIDNDIHWKAMEKGHKVYLMEGVYLYHWYRGGDPTKKDHLL